MSKVTPGRSAVSSPSYSRQEIIAHDLMQLLRRDFFGDDEAIRISDREILDKLNNPAAWLEFLRQYEKLDNTEFQSFIMLKLTAFEDNLIEQHANAAQSKADAAEIAKITAATGVGVVFVSGAAFKAGAAIAADLAATGGAITLIAVGSVLVRNYFGRQQASTQKDINLVKRRKSEVGQKMEDRSQEGILKGVNGG